MKLNSQIKTGFPVVIPSPFVETEGVRLFKDLHKVTYKPILFSFDHYIQGFIRL